MSMSRYSLHSACCLMILVALLAGCGWQLQGAQRVPEQLVPLYLDLDDLHSAFAKALTERLRIAAVPVTTQRSQAQAILRISRDSSGHHVTSVSALNEPQQYEVYYTIEYRLDQAQGAGNLLPPQAVNVSRTMSYDKTLILAKQREELALRDRLAEEIADQVLRRLSRVPTSPVPVAVNESGA